MSILWSLDQLSPSALLAMTRRRQNAEIQLVFSAIRSAQEQVQDVRLLRIEEQLVRLEEERQEEDGFLVSLFVEVAFTAVTIAFPPLAGLRTFLLLRHAAAGRFLIRSLSSDRRRILIGSLLKGAREVVGRRLKKAATESLEDLLSEDPATGTSLDGTEGGEGSESQGPTNQPPYDASFQGGYLEAVRDQFADLPETRAIDLKAQNAKELRNCLDVSLTDSVGVRLLKEQRVELQGQIEAQEQTLDLTQELIDLCEKHISAGRGDEALEVSDSGNLALGLLDELASWWSSGEASTPFGEPEPETLTWKSLLESITQTLLEIASSTWPESSSGAGFGASIDGSSLSLPPLSGVGSISSRLPTTDFLPEGGAETFEILSLFFEAAIWIKLHGRSIPPRVLVDGESKRDPMLERYFDCRFPLLKHALYRNRFMDTQEFFQRIAQSLSSR